MTTRRRAVLCVPASEPFKVSKAGSLAVDEIMVDLEDAVPPDQKVAARQTVAKLTRREAGSVAVRVNALGSPWAAEDLAAVAANGVIDTVVLPKVESAADILHTVAELERLEPSRRAPLRLQVLIESAIGLTRVADIAVADRRIEALILGYADLAASLGRRPDAPWSFAQDAVLLAARCAGVDAIDGPLLSVADGNDLLESSRDAAARGYDGKWVIHPRQTATVTSVFTPSGDEVARAREILRALSDAERSGRGALEWKGQMLDEAVAVQARRTLARGTQ